jgi:hypothetical protein
VTEQYPGLPILPALFPAFFIGMWLGVASLLSVLGGWRGLSEMYGAPDQFRLQPADRFRARSLQMRGFGIFPVNYSNCITVGVTDQGLYLVPLFLFRFLHPPLLIPWAAITDRKEGSSLWLHWSELELRGTGTRIRVYGSLGELVESEWRRHRTDPAAA